MLVILAADFSAVVLGDHHARRARTAAFIAIGPGAVGFWFGRIVAGVG